MFNDDFYDYEKFIKAAHELGNVVTTPKKINKLLSKFKKKFDLAYCVVSTFKYLLTEDDARSHLRCVAKALKPGGIYVLGFHITDDDQISRMRERWVGQRGKTKVVCNIQSWPPDLQARVEKVRSRLIVTEPETGGCGNIGEMQPPRRLCAC